MAVTAAFRCGACGSTAATLTLLAPGEPGSRLPGAATLVIDGGPVSVAIAPVSFDPVALMLRGPDAGALFALDPELAPCWCPACDASYCGVHWRTETVFDQGFFDCVRGTCPMGHERMLQD